MLNVEFGGWVFEYENVMYLDLDDMVVVFIVFVFYRDDFKWKVKGISEVIDWVVNWMFVM